MRRVNNLLFKFTHVLLSEGRDYHILPVTFLTSLCMLHDVMIYSCDCQSPKYYLARRGKRTNILHVVLSNLTLLSSVFCQCARAKFFHFEAKSPKLLKFLLDSRPNMPPAVHQLLTRLSLLFFLRIGWDSFLTGGALTLLGEGLALIAFC